MLNTAPVHAVLPTTDIERARSFYSKSLGLKPLTPAPPDGAMFEAGEGTRILVYQRGPAKSEHTQATFMVRDVEKAVKELRAQGVKFEEYDMPGLKTVNGIASMGSMKTAWFKDPDGNILAVAQP